MFIHRPEYYKQTLYYDSEKKIEIPRGIEIIIAKYREGQTGSVFLQHDGRVKNIKDFDPSSIYESSQFPTRRNEPIFKNDEMPF